MAGVDFTQVCHLVQRTQKTTMIDKDSMPHVLFA